MTTEVRIELTSDLTPMESIKVGRHAEPVRFTDDPSGETVTFGSSEVTPGCTRRVPRSPAATTRPALVLTWLVTIPAGGVMELDWLAGVTDTGAVVVPARGPGLAADSITDRLAGGRSGADPRLAPWLRQSLHDLNGLRMATTEAPDDAFFAAGVAVVPHPLRPRQPLDLPDAAAGRRPPGRRDPAGPGRLAGHRGRRGHRPGAGQDPARAAAAARTPSTTPRLPPLYYGTIDATPLWICLLHDAWRAGLAEAEVDRPAAGARGRPDWLVTYGDADGDGFLEYLDASGHGLANQGWKDSADSVRFADGRIAEGPVALCEVQGYAYEAAIGGAALLEAFGRPGAERYRAWAAALAEKFRAAFWCGDGDGRFPALALDGGKQRVDS